MNFYARIEPSDAVLRGASSTSAGAADDPILIVFASRNALHEAHSRLWDLLDEKEGEAKKVLGRRPWGLISWRHYSAMGGDEIEDRREEFLSRPGADPGKVEREYQDAKSRERAAIQAGKEWDQKAGIAELREAEQTAQRKSDEAETLLSETIPTTALGAATILEFIADDMEGSDVEWHPIAVRNIAKGLRSGVARDEVPSPMDRSITIDYAKIAALSAKELWTLADMLGTLDDVGSGLACKGTMYRENTRYNAAGEMAEDVNEFLRAYREAVIEVAKKMTTDNADAEGWRWWTVLQFEAEMTEDLSTFAAMASQASTAEAAHK